MNFEKMTNVERIAFLKGKIKLYEDLQKMSERPDRIQFIINMYQDELNEIARRL